MFPFRWQALAWPMFPFHWQALAWVRAPQYRVSRPCSKQADGPFGSVQLTFPNVLPVRFVTSDSGFYRSVDNDNNSG